jgi:Fe-S-cluster containining protein
MADRTPEETQAYAEGTVSAFYDAITDEEEREFRSDLKRVVTVNARAANKMKEIHVIADKAFRHAAGRVACARGCAHCCYIAVTMTSVEAKCIGEQIGVEPKDAAHAAPRNPASFSNDTPCPFLENDECSIYEYRPLECRTHFNFDRDSYWCRYENAEGALIPKPVIPQLGAARDLVSMGKNAPPIFGDIRDFFPQGKAAAVRT